MRNVKLMTQARFAKQGEALAIVALPHTWNALDGQDGGADYWRGLGMSYSMDGFRQDVKKLVDKASTPDPEPAVDLEALKAELKQYIDQKIETSVQNACVTLATAYGQALDVSLEAIDDQIENAISKATGVYIEHLKDITSTSVKDDLAVLLACGAINGGTPADIDDSDIRMRYQDIRVLAVMKRYVDKKIEEAKK